MQKRSYISRLLVGIVFVSIALLTSGVPGLAAPITFTTLGSPPSFQEDIGIDYSDLTGNLVTSVHLFTSGVPNNLDNVDRITGARSDAAPTFTGRFDELKLATARITAGTAACPQNAPVGTIFTANGVGQVAMITPVGTVSAVTLPGEQATLRGGFYFDYQCVIATALATTGVNHLVVVSGDGDPNGSFAGGKVWIVPINAGATFGVPVQEAAILKDAGINAGKPAHLEGVIVVPNLTKYGPWAGKIVTGDEDRITVPGGYTNGPDPRIYAIDPSTGAVLTSTTGPPSATQFQISGPVPHPEDFDFIVGDFYGVSYFDSSSTPPVGQILKASGSAFDAALGDILITQEYPVDQPDILTAPAGNGTGAVADIGANSGLYQIRWDSGTSAFVSTLLTRDTSGPSYSQWEHVTLVPQAALNVVKTPDGTSFTQGSQFSFTIVVSNPGTGTATNVQLTDALPGNGGLVWASASPTQGTCVNPIVGNSLSCSLGNILAGGSVTVTVTSTATTPLAACQSQPNPVALATADGGLTAQDSGSLTCTPPPQNLVTVTQGGWHATPHGNNPGTVLNAYFTAHPGYTPKIGDISNACGGKTLTFTSANAIRAFLPASGMPGVLTATATNPTSSSAGVFAGQVLALTLNTQVLSSGSSLLSFVMPSGPAAGETVATILADADKALGGCGLPSYASSISTLNDIVTSINEMFD
jgi:uncharacterized repeat protein (TIGR01451 family)